MLEIYQTLAIAGLLAASAVAEQPRTDQPTVSRAELFAESFDSGFNVERIVSQRIEMAPQISGQRHYHPVPVVGYVVSGEIAFQIEGQETQVLRAGDVFFEPADAIIVRWENVGTTRAVFVANYLALKDTDSLLVRVD